MLQIIGGDVHRAFAYFRAGLALDGYGKNVLELAERGALQEVPGVGQGISAKVQRYIQEGSFDLLDDLEREVPAWLMRVSEFPGIGPRTLSALYRAQLRDPPALAEESFEAPQSLRLSSPQIARVRQALQAEARPTIQLAHAEAVATDLAAWLSEGPAWRVELTGAIRRRQDSVREIELIVGVDASQALRLRLNTYRLADGSREESQGCGPSKLPWDSPFGSTLSRTPPISLGSGFEPPAPLST